MIRLRCASFAYDGGREVLAGLDLSVAAGDLVQVVGPSGSGKTALARLLAGQTGADGGAVFRGSLTLGSERLDFSGSTEDPRIDPAAWSATVAYAAQGAWGQLSMISSTVAEEIAFGPANRGMPVAELRAAVHSVADRLHLTDLLDRDPRRLSGGQLQRTILAAAVVGNPKVLVLDEPFQGLDDDGRADLTSVLDDLRAAGTGIVLCAPLLPASAPAGSRVLALADGRPVLAGSLEEAQRSDLGRYGIGTEGAAPVPAAGRPPLGPLLPSAPSTRAGFRRGPDILRRRRAEPSGSSRLAGTEGPLAELTGVSFTYGGSPGRPALSGVDLTIAPGDIVALTGANGSGKSTLLQHLNGLLRPSSGTVTVGGELLGRRPVGRLAGSVGFLFQDTDQQLFERTVLREVSYGPEAAGVPRAGALDRAAAALSAVGLAPSAGEHPYELGFVERRFVALASLIASGPALWALDEPTAGLDQGGRTRMAELILGRAAAGGAVVLATHDAAFAAALCTRILELEGGRILSERRRPGQQADASQ